MDRPAPRQFRILLCLLLAAGLTGCVELATGSSSGGSDSAEVVAPAPAPAPAPNEREVILTEQAPEPIGPYSQAIRVGDMVFVSGQIGADPETRRLVEGGVEAEARQALYNIQAILQAAGAELRHVAQCQVFLADIGDYAAVNAVYASFFAEEPPARAALQVAALPAGAQVEILCTAVHRA